MIEIISRLPEGYQEVEYIESSGTQYIDTGVKPNQDTGVTIDFQLTNVSSWQCIFGAANSAQNADEYGVWHSGTKFGFYYASTNVTVGVNATTRHQFVCSKNSLSVDGTAYSSPVYTNFTTNYNLILCAVNYAGNINYSASVKLYSAKIYANGVLVRDFIPCKNVNGVVGLWDNVNNQFYTNSGSGTFTAGRDVGDIVITPGGVIPMQYARRRIMINKDKKGPWIVTLNGMYRINEPCSIGNPVRYNGKKYTVSGYNNPPFEVNGGDVIAVGYFNGNRITQYNRGYVAVDGQRVTNSAEQQCGYYYYTVRSDVVVTGFFNDNPSDIQEWYMGANITTQ